jgi:uncharacterized Tic20 family protein
MNKNFAAAIGFAVMAAVFTALAAVSGIVALMILTLLCVICAVILGLRGALNRTCPACRRDMPAQATVCPFCHTPLGVPTV